MKHRASHDLTTSPAERQIIRIAWFAATTGLVCGGEPSHLVNGGQVALRRVRVSRRGRRPLLRGRRDAAAATAGRRRGRLRTGRRGVTGDGPSPAQPTRHTHRAAQADRDGATGFIPGTGFTQYYGFQRAMIRDNREETHKAKQSINYKAVC